MYHSLSEIPIGEVIMKKKKYIYMVYISYKWLIYFCFISIVCQVLHSWER